MPALITLALLMIAVVVVMVLRFLGVKNERTWLAAALGGLAAWGSVFFWQISMPVLLPAGFWKPVSLFAISPALKVDSLAWVYALSLTGLAAAVMLTSAAQPFASAWSWVASLGLTMLGVLAFLAANPLTLVMVWMALDITELLNTLRGASDARMSERAVMSFSTRAAGTGFALWASVTSAMIGSPFLFESLRPESALYLLIAAGLRVGVLPLHLAAEPQMRRGLGSVLRLTAAASSLAMLSRLPQAALPQTSLLVLQAITLLAALYGGWKWFSGAEPLALRPFWLIGMSALTLLQAFGGNAIGAAAWGATLIVTGGGAFLAFARPRRLQLALSFLTLFSLGLPFSLTAAGWGAALPWFFWPLALLAHSFLMAGTMFDWWRSTGRPWEELPQWGRAPYPLGLLVLLLTALLLGLWGWPGALRLGNWATTLGSLALTAGLFFVRWRLANLIQSTTPAEEISPALASRLSGLQETLAGLLWWLFRTLRRGTFFLTGLLEGEGGLFWTLLALTIFALLL